MFQLLPGNVLKLQFAQQAHDLFMNLGGLSVQSLRHMNHIGGQLMKILAGGA